MDLFKLVARLALNKKDYEEGLDDAKKDADSFGKKIGDALKNAAKIGAAAITAASAAVGVMGKKIIDNYADYEQLVGGVETLFKDSAGKVEKYASDAFRTAGMSANDYMATVTGFSASLLQSLGGDTAKAADYADMAIRDMSDNANKMGTDMSSIQTAYQGFAKQNYTMLDNLKLGYGGTKEEMARLIEDAEKLNGQFKASRDENGELAMSYADIVDAIHIVQENMGITGTTAKEASKTISGSIGALKGAWDNLITGLGQDKADIDKLIADVLYSAETALFNLIPRIEQILKTIGDVIPRVLPYIVDKLPLIVNGVLPPLLSTAGTLVSALAEALVALLPTLLDVGAQLLMTLAQGLNDNLPAIGQTAVEIITALAATLSQLLPELIPVAVSVILTLIETLTEPGNLSNLIDAAIQIILALVEGLIKGIPRIIAAIPTIIGNLLTAIVQSLPQIVGAGVQLIGALAQGIVGAVGTAVTAFGQVVGGLAKGAGDLIKGAVDWGKNTVHNIAEGMRAAKEKVSGVLQTVGKGIADWAGGIAKNAPTFGANMIRGFGSGIVNDVKTLWDIYNSLDENTKKKFLNLAKSAITWGKDVMTSFANGIKQFISKPIDAIKWLADKIKSFIGFSEPEDGPLSNFHTYAPDMMQLFAEGIRDNAGMITDAIGSAFDFGTRIVPAAAAAGGGEEYIVPRVDNGGGRDITIILELDGQQFGRAVYRANNDETQRVGTRVAMGGAY